MRIQIIRKHWQWRSCWTKGTRYICPPPCAARQHNEWVASKWYRRWVADLREFLGDRENPWGLVMVLAAGSPLVLFFLMWVTE